MPRDFCMKYYMTMILIIIADQAVKYAVRANMAVGQSINVLGSFFRITYVQNSGAAFSMFSGARLFLIALPLAAIAVTIWYFTKHRRDGHSAMLISLILITSGGLGNLIDRICAGWVTDMFDFSIFPPVFNVADISVCLGCALLIVYVIFLDRENKNE